MMHILTSKEYDEAKYNLLHDNIVFWNRSHALFCFLICCDLFSKAIYIMSVSMNVKHTYIKCKLLYFLQ